MQDDQNPSNIVDQALNDCIEQVERGFVDFTPAPADLLDRLRESLKQDFISVLDHAGGVDRWRKDGPKVKAVAYLHGRIAYTLALLREDEESKIQAEDIGEGLRIVQEVCKVESVKELREGIGPANRAAYCEKALDRW